MTIEPREVSAWVVGPGTAALQPVPDAPRLSEASCGPLRDISVLDEGGIAKQLQVPVERPLTVVVDDRELVTLMTLGARPELLVLGFLRNQRLIGDVAAVESITVDWASGVAAVRTRPNRSDSVADTASPPDRWDAAVGGTLPLDRQDGAAGAAHALVGTGCGLGTVFADWLGQAGGTAFAPAARVSRSILLRLLDTMRHHDAIHRAAGSVHSCALFQGPDLLACVEDVSRHNGVDTVTGWMALHGLPGADKILFTTGRLTAEMVMKSAHNGIPIVVSRNGATAMGCDIAAQLGMALFGRAAKRRFFCYVGAERFDAESAAG